MTSQTVRRAAPLVAAVAVLAVVGGVALLVRDAPTAPGSSEPPPLQIGTAMTTGDAASARDRVTVGVELPEGPASARVHGLDEDDAALQRLARVLGVAPDDVLGPDAVGPSGVPVLRVGTGPGRPWQFARADAFVCLDQLPGAAPDDPVASCASPPAGGRPGPDEPPTSAAAADAARPLLDALGLGPDVELVEQVSADTRTLRVDPPVDELPTYGFGTTVTVDAAGVLSATGWLGSTTAGDSYPVISAQAAVDQLAAMPVPLLACPDSSPEMPPAPRCGGPLEVTGVAFGLSLQWEGERPLLVPSWLFSVAGGTEPLAVVAVDPAYLAPVPADDEPGSGSTGSGGSSGAPGTAEPSVGAPPVAPHAQPSTRTSRFESVAPAEGGSGLTVSFYGGVEACYEYRVVARESGRQVDLRLVESRTGEEVCIDLAQLYERVVPLEAPLGSRVVRDADTGLPLYPVRAEG